MPLPGDLAWRYRGAALRVQISGARGNAGRANHRLDKLRGSVRCIPDARWRVAPPHCAGVYRYRGNCWRDSRWSRTAARVAGHGHLHCRLGGNRVAPTPLRSSTKKTFATKSTRFGLRRSRAEVACSWQMPPSACFTLHSAKWRRAICHREYRPFAHPKSGRRSE